MHTALSEHMDRMRYVLASTFKCIDPSVRPDTMENTLPVGGTHECNHACMWSIIGDEGFRGTRPGPPPYPHTLEGRACTLTLLCVCACVRARALSTPRTTIGRTCTYVVMNDTHSGPCMHYILRTLRTWPVCASLARQFHASIFNLFSQLLFIVRVPLYVHAPMWRCGTHWHALLLAS
jgi:hypothetical protein